MTTTLALRLAPAAQALAMHGTVAIDAERQAVVDVGSSIGMRRKFQNVMSLQIALRSAMLAGEAVALENRPAPHREGLAKPSAGALFGHATLPSRRRRSTPVGEARGAAVDLRTARDLFESDAAALALRVWRSIAPACLAAEPSGRGAVGVDFEGRAAALAGLGDADDAVRARLHEPRRTVFNSLKPSA